LGVFGDDLTATALDSFDNETDPSPHQLKEDAVKEDEILLGDF
jgi:hypothetical protein